MILALNLILIFMMLIMRTIPAAAASKSAVSSSSLATYASKRMMMTMKKVKNTSHVMAFVRTSPSIQQRRHGQHQQPGLQQQSHGHHYKKFYQTNHNDQLSKVPSMLRLTNKSSMIRSTSYHSSSSMSLSMSSLPTLDQVSLTFLAKKKKSKHILVMICRIDDDTHKAWRSLMEIFVVLVVM